MTSQQNEVNDNKEVYAIIGEVVLIASALDALLNAVMVEVLHLGASPLIQPVVATLEPVRKIEILKERARFVRNEGWRKHLKAFITKAEGVFRQRNIACHLPVTLENDTWTFTPVSAAKVLKHLDLQRPKALHISFNDLKAAISTGEEALAEGLSVIDNFGRANAARQKRYPQPRGAKTKTSSVRTRNSD